MLAVHMHSIIRWLYELWVHVSGGKLSTLTLERITNILNNRNLHEFCMQPYGSARTPQAELWAATPQSPLVGRANSQLCSAARFVQACLAPGKAQQFLQEYMVASSQLPMASDLTQGRSSNTPLAVAVLFTPLTTLGTPTAGSFARSIATSIATLAVNAIVWDDCCHRGGCRRQRSRGCWSRRSSHWCAPVRHRRTKFTVLEIEVLHVGIG